MTPYKFARCFRVLAHCDGEGPLKFTLIRKALAIAFTDCSDLVPQTMSPPCMSCVARLRSLPPQAIRPDAC